MTTNVRVLGGRRERLLHLGRRAHVDPPLDAPGVGGCLGPATSVTEAPRAAAAAASQAIFPDERLPRKRTSSTGSCVGPRRRRRAGRRESRDRTRARRDKDSSAP